MLLTHSVTRLRNAVFYYLILTIFCLSGGFSHSVGNIKCVFICSDFRPTSLEKGQEIVRLRFYKVYAWGVPLIITGTAATLDHMRKNAMTEVTFLQPRFCEKEYWFAGKLYSCIVIDLLNVHDARRVIGLFNLNLFDTELAR